MSRRSSIDVLYDFDWLIKRFIKEPLYSNYGGWFSRKRIYNNSINMIKDMYGNIQDTTSLVYVICNVVLIDESITIVIRSLIWVEKPFETKRHKIGRTKIEYLKCNIMIIKELMK